uniref:Ubiquitin hydrolase n=1 Tax=Tanacetum cinerariifolium TaxID=118510 RepID=A0A6L2KTV0_TANCI|nr:ubiquitin hydrolase [Tanacetum cinerariifolium]
MAISKNDVYNDSHCSKSCKKNTNSLNTKITNLNEALSENKTNLYHYKVALSQVEARLIEFKTQEIKFCEMIRGLEFDVKNKNIKIENLMNELEQIKKEKEGLDSKLTGFEYASKDLDTLLGSQRSDKNKEGLGYNDVPPPAQVYSPSKKDMSWTGLPEFADDTITNYNRPSPSIEIDCAEVKTNKAEAARKPSIKYAEMYKNTSKSPKVRGNQRNWNNLKTQQLGKDFVMKNKACFKCSHFDHLAYDCGVWVEKGKNWPKNNFAHKNVTPRADLFKTASVSAARHVNTAAPRPNVNSARPKTTQDLVIIKLIQRVKRLERELKTRTQPTKIQKVDVRGRSRSVMAWVPKKV